MRAVPNVALSVCGLLFFRENVVLGGGLDGLLLPGDVNLDGRVSISDPVALTLYLGLCCGPPSPRWAACFWAQRVRLPLIRLAAGIQLPIASNATRYDSIASSG